MFVKIVGQPQEIRMGSPYNTCQLKFTGTNLDLPTSDWQDKYAWSDNNRHLVLIRWNTENNEPGFQFYIIDNKTTTLVISERILGMVNDLKVEGNKIMYNKFYFDKENSKPGMLCCHTDEVYEIG